MHRTGIVERMRHRVVLVVSLSSRKHCVLVYSLRYIFLNRNELRHRLWRKYFGVVSYSRFFPHSLSPPHLCVINEVLDNKISQKCCLCSRVQVEGFEAAYFVVVVIIDSVTYRTGLSGTKYTASVWTQAIEVMQGAMAIVFASF